MEVPIEILCGVQIDLVHFTKFFQENRKFYIDTVEHFQNYFELNPSGIFAAIQNDTKESVGLKFPMFHLLNQL